MQRRATSQKDGMDKGLRAPSESMILSLRRSRTTDFPPARRRRARCTRVPTVTIGTARRAERRSHSCAAACAGATPQARSMWISASSSRSRCSSRAASTASRSCDATACHRHPVGQLLLRLQQRVDELGRRRGRRPLRAPYRRTSASSSDIRCRTLAARTSRCRRRQAARRHRRPRGSGPRRDSVMYGLSGTCTRSPAATGRRGWFFTYASRSRSADRSARSTRARVLGLASVRPLHRLGGAGTWSTPSIPSTTPARSPASRPSLGGRSSQARGRRSCSMTSLTPSCASVVRPRRIGCHDHRSVVVDRFGARMVVAGPPRGRRRSSSETCSSASSLSSRSRSSSARSARRRIEEKLRSRTRASSTRLVPLLPVDVAADVNALASLRPFLCDLTHLQTPSVLWRFCRLSISVSTMSNDPPIRAVSWTVHRQ